MPDLRIIQARQEAAAYVAAQEQAYVNHQANHAVKKEILDTLNDMHEKINQIDEGFARVNNIHIPSTWEVITQFVTNCCRWVGSLFTGRH